MKKTGVIHTGSELQTLQHARTHKTPSQNNGILLSFNSKNTRYLFWRPRRTAHRPEGARSNGRGRPSAAQPLPRPFAAGADKSPAHLAEPFRLSHWLPFAPPPASHWLLRRLIGCFRVSPPVTRALSFSVRYLEGSEERLPPPPFTRRRSLSLETEPAC